MIATSVKIKGFSCFQKDWAGFDEFKPINLIIGRNNTGKSHLLDVVEHLCGNRLYNPEWEMDCAGELDESSLRKFFSERFTGGELDDDHWHGHGRRFVGQPIKWHFSRGTSIPVGFEYKKQMERLLTDEQLNARKIHIQKLLDSATTPLSGLKFRRLLADRDIQPEVSSEELVLADNGRGATNLLDLYLRSSKRPSDLIQKTLLDALNEIYGGDGSFTLIDTKHHVESDDSSLKGKREIYLREDSKGLVPLSRSGSSLKTVILVLLNLLVIPDRYQSPRNQYVFAFEELENNLHPALLRRLLGYLERFVEREKVILFLTTHSNVALDYFGPSRNAQTIHVSHNGESAYTKTISAHFDRCGILTEIGARPSDLLQANGVIWVEGPSDRIYLNRFIEIFADGNLREGRDYQCAFYGGSLLAQSQFTSPEDESDELANLLRLNNNFAVVCDGDRTASEGDGANLKDRVLRIQHELSENRSSHLWITDAKEIENYIPKEVWTAVYGIDVPCDPSLFDRFSTDNLGENSFVKKHLKRSSFDKVKFAIQAVPHLTRELLSPRFELESQMTTLVNTIRRWNGATP